MRINGPLNKERVTKEYKARVKIWNSELNGNNKVIAHYSFAVPVLTKTIRILNWTKKEISDLDIMMARKIMNMTGALHTAGDIDRLYIKRKKGGRGLRSIEDMYEIQTVGSKKRLDEVSKRHSLLSLVEKREKDKIARLGEECIQWHKEFQESCNVKQGTQKEHKNNWKEKVTHGFLQKKLEHDENGRHEQN